VLLDDVHAGLARDDADAAGTNAPQYCCTGRGVLGDDRITGELDGFTITA
jgi:hypothetical protein